MISNELAKDGNSGDFPIFPVRYEFAPDSEEPLVLDSGVCGQCYFEDELGHSDIILTHFAAGYASLEEWRSGDESRSLIVIEDHRISGDNRVLFAWPYDANREEVYLWVCRRVREEEVATGQTAHMGNIGEILTQK